MCQEESVAILALLGGRLNSGLVVYFRRTPQFNKCQSEILGVQFSSTTGARFRLRIMALTEWFSNLICPGGRTGGRIPLSVGVSPASTDGTRSGDSARKLSSEPAPSQGSCKTPANAILLSSPTQRR